MKIALALTLFLALAGCATEPWEWRHPQHADRAIFDRDVAQCQYEAAHGTASYSQGQTARTLGGAIAQGLSEGMEIASRRNELGTLCLKARGYYQAPVSQAAYSQYITQPPPQAVTPPPPPPNQPPPAKVATVAPQATPVAPTITKPVGKSFDVDKVYQLQPGVSTVDDATAAFGRKPNAESSLADNTKLFQWIEVVGYTSSHVGILFDSGGKMIKVQHKFSIGQ